MSSDPLYFTEFPNDTITDALKKVIRIDSVTGKPYFAVNFFDNIKILYDNLSEDPDAHATKATMYIKENVPYVRKSVADGGGIESLSLRTDLNNSISVDHYNFDGLNDYIEIPGSNPNVNFGDGDFSIVPGLIKIDKISSYMHLIGKRSLNAGDYAINNYSANQFIVFVARGSTDEIQTDFSGVNIPYELNKAFYLAYSISRSGDNMTVTAYVNGIPYAEETKTITGLLTSASNFRIGNGWNASYFFSGCFSNPKLFNRALDSSEMLKLAQGKSLDFADIGASNGELITNGSFETDTNWIKDSGITISEGKAVFTDVMNGGFLIQTPVNLVPNKLYKITFTISDYVKGSVRVRFPGTTIAQSFSANGTYTVYQINVGIIVELRLQASSSSTTLKIDNVSATQVGCILDLNQKGIGHNGWTGILGGKKISATNNGATVVDSNPNRTEDFITGIFTTDIASGVGSKIIKQPPGYEVEDFGISDEGTTAGLSNIQLTQETSGSNLITGKSVASGESKNFRRSIADHNIYDVEKNLTLTATGNGALGMKVFISFKKVQ